MLISNKILDMSSKQTLPNAEDTRSGFLYRSRSPDLLYRTQGVNPRSSFCLIHAKLLDMKCLDCDGSICVDCALSEAHKGHQIQNASPFAPKFSEVKERLNFKLAKIKGNLTQTSKKFASKLEVLRKEKIDEVNVRFEQLVKELNRLQGKIISEIDLHYETIGNSHQVLKKGVEKKLTFLTSSLRTEKLGDLEKIKQELKNLRTVIASGSFSSPTDNDTMQIIFSGGFEKSLTNFCTLSFKSLFHPIKKFSITDEDNLLFETLAENLASFPDDRAFDNSLAIYETPNNEEISLIEERRGDLIPVLKTLSETSTVHKRPAHSKTPLDRERLLDFVSFSEIVHSPIPRRQPSENIPHDNLRRKEPSPIPMGMRNSVTISQLRKLEPGRNTVGQTKTSNQLTSRESQMLKSSPHNRLLGKDKAIFLLGTPASAKQLVVDLTNTSIDDGFIKQNIRSFESLKAAKHLVLNKNAISVKGLNNLLKSVTNLKIETISLESNCLGNKVFDLLLYFCRFNSHLKTVYIRDNPIDRTIEETRQKIDQLKARKVEIII